MTIWQRKAAKSGVSLQATVEEIEQAFWDVVEAGEEPTEVMYGADLDTSVLGSAFHTKARDGSLPSDEADRHYATSPWNLNNLPSLGDSLLKHLDDSIAGVTLPWMYMGMMFSSFCWHIEDHMFYSSEISVCVSFQTACCSAAQA